MIKFLSIFNVSNQFSYSCLTLSISATVGTFSEAECSTDILCTEEEVENVWASRRSMGMMAFFLCMNAPNYIHKILNALCKQYSTTLTTKTLGCVYSAQTIRVCSS